MSARLLQVIESTDGLRGDGKDLAFRTLIRYFSPEGELLAEVDPLVGVSPEALLRNEADLLKQVKYARHDRALLVDRLDRAHAEVRKALTTLRVGRCRWCHANGSRGHRKWCVLARLARTCDVLGEIIQEAVDAGKTPVAGSQMFGLAKDSKEAFLRDMAAAEKKP